VYCEKGRKTSERANERESINLCFIVTVVTVWCDLKEDSFGWKRASHSPS
jgi:hypothetical protein